MSSRYHARLVAMALGAALGAAALTAGPQVARPPAVHSLITTGRDGKLTITAGDGSVYTERERPVAWTLAQLRGSPRGTANGLAFDFGKPGFTGTLAFGLVPYDGTRHPLPVYRTISPIVDGKAQIDIKATLSGVYDMVGWSRRGRGVIGFRVIAADGLMLHDGRVAFKGTGPFEVDVTMLEGPFVSNVTEREAVIWFELDRAAPCAVEVTAVPGNPSFGPARTPRLARDRNASAYPCAPGSAHQEITISRLAPGTEYRYTVRYGEGVAGQEAGAAPDGQAGAAAAREETYGFRTAPRPGSRTPFTFAYTSDSRGGTGGGERNVLGPNALMVRRIAALAADRRAAFLQFTGDLVTGSGDTPGARLMELANWKQAIEPHAHWLPVYAGVGNHEAVLRDFAEPGGQVIRVPRFPFDTESTEAAFARGLVNPVNGPVSEDGATYDPDPSAVDFPSYRENVYSYTHDNVAMVVLNSDYWYSSSISRLPQVGGNPTGYLMDVQMKWLARQLDAFERSAAIDHVFLTVHTPMFPNGGHVGSSMYYGGSNEPRPWVAGKPVAKGIIERRDDLVRLIQDHRKVLAVLVGDEHNYNRLRIGPGTRIYPEGWKGARVDLRRSFYQVINGAAGAPYYAQDRTPPWSAQVEAFSAQNAVCLFHVKGPRVRIEVINPETLEVIDRAVLR